MRQIGLGTFEATPEMFNLVNQVLRSNRLSYGPLSQEFESRFAQMHGCEYGVLSNSGTSSLLVALQTLKELHGWQDGDIIFVPALTFVATVNTVLQAKLKPVLIDVEKDYYGISINQVYKHMKAEARYKRLRAIIPVHTFGQPCDMLGLKRVCKSHKWYPEIKIIEDSCESMFVKHDNKPVGSFSDIACFSTYIAHLLVTGIGGLSTTNNPEYAQYMRSLIHHGIDLTELPVGESYDPTWLARKFRFTKVGHSFRVTELEAALGLAQLDTLADSIKQRQLNAEYFTKNLQPLEDKELLQLPKVRPNTESAWMMYTVLALTESKRNLMAYLVKNGIGVRDALPLTNQPVYKGLFNEDDYPVAKFINEHGLYWGCHSGMTREDLDYLIERVFNYYGY